MATVGHPGSPGSPGANRALLARALQLHRAGHLGDAERAYADYLESHPDDPIALNNAGALAMSMGNARGAVARFERVVMLVPNNVQALSNLGYALVGVGRAMEAVGHLERAVQLDPQNALAYNNLGIAFERAGARPQAIHAFERALEINPRYADAAVNLGSMHNRRNDTVASRTAFSRALAIDPLHLAAKTGMAHAQALDGDPGGARLLLDALAGSMPNSASFWQTLALVRHWSGDLPAARDAYRKAAQLDPNDFDARFGIASTLLGEGNYPAGWRAFEERPMGCLGPQRVFLDVPLWDGKPLRGPLLIHAEQGLGDVIQFARFVPLAAERAAGVILVADGNWRSLLPLLATLRPAPILLDDPAKVGQQRTAPAARTSILSLPFLLDIDGSTLPGRIPYLRAPEEDRKRWHLKISSLAPPRVGLAWSSLVRGDHAYLSQHKSIPLELLAPLVATPEVEFVSLQVGAGSDLAPLGQAAARVADLGAEIRDFGDTAAIIEQLDLVISVDTSVAHVAGALGKPIWLLDRFNTCWRWRPGQRESIWYPSLRIFRQQRMLDWSAPLAATKIALDQWLAAGPTGPRH